MVQFSSYHIRSVGEVDGKTTLAAVFSKNSCDYHYIEGFFEEPRRIESWESVFQEKNLAERIARSEKQGYEVDPIERKALADLQRQNAQLAEASVPTPEQ
jgi:hypothetical protein